MKKLKVIIIGAGSRGIIYNDEMLKLPSNYEVVGVAEPIESRRNYIKNSNSLPDDRCFTDYKPLLALGKIADIAVISTMDRQHFEPAMKAIEIGYDLLLEKPIAPTAEECIKITRAAKQKGKKVLICTVLRYTDLFVTLKNLINSGKIGDIISINHEECVGNIHQSHSFVRGNWGNEERSSGMLLQKSCHDIDLLQWLIGKKCLKVQSFGALTYFTERNAPKGAPEYCIQGCPAGETCPYNAVKLYLDDKQNQWFRTTCAREYAPSDDDIINSISKTQYGKCVYKCDNNVVDHQTVNMLFEDDITVTFTMNAFNRGGRFIHIMGTRGEIHATLADDQPITVYSFETKNTKTIDAHGKNDISGGHGGGDAGIIRALYDYMLGQYHGSSVPDIEGSCYNHLIAFAAEEARKSGNVVKVQSFIENLH